MGGSEGVVDGSDEEDDVGNERSNTMQDKFTR